MRDNYVEVQLQQSAYQHNYLACRHTAFLSISQ